MMSLPRPALKRRPENTIPLINIVFLLLMFFLVAGSIAPSPDDAITLVSTDEADTATVSNLFGLRADGTLVHQGSTVDETAAIALLPESEEPLYLAVDQDSPASRLVEVVAALRQAGAQSVIVITERTP